MQKDLFNTATVYSQHGCTACDTAVALLKRKDYVVEVRKIGEGEAWSKKDLLDAVPNARSVPQIFINNNHIGGLPQLQEFLKNIQ